MNTWIRIILVLLTLQVSALAQKGRREAEEGNAMYRDQNFQQALELYEQGLTRAPESKILQFNRGDARYKLGELGQAIEDYQAALGFEEAPARAKAFYNLGNALLREGKPGESVEAYKESLRLDPSDVDAKYNLELALRQLQQNPQEDQSGQGSKSDDQEQNSDRKEAQQPNEKSEAQSAKEDSGRNEKRQNADEKSQSSEQREEQEKREENQSSASRQDEKKDGDQSPVGDGKSSEGSKPDGELSRQQAEQLLSAIKEDPKDLLKRRFIPVRRGSAAKDW